jgi:hypothetical protein
MVKKILFLRDGRKECLHKEWRVSKVVRPQKKRFEMLSKKIDGEKKAIRPKLEA